MIWLTQIPALTDWVLLLLRLVVGLMFALSGYFKLTKPDRTHSMQQTLTSAGVPAAFARPLSVIEMLAGASLLVGLLSVPSALALLGISVVAFATVTLPNAKGHGIHKLENLLYAPETLLSAALLVLIATGAGDWSLDRLIVG